MYVSKEFLLSELPPCRDEWVIVAKKQEVIRDIIPEMVDAYGEFAPYYDRIGLFFEGNSIAQTCDNLYDFCKQELRYKEEPEEWQTSALPAGILTRGFCDCKGYASFIGGCLGAIARATGEPIDWCYFFASYRKDKPTPYHVFVEVRTPDGPLWIDPTPGSDRMDPEHWICERPPEPARVRNVAGRVTQDGELVYEAVGALPSSGDPATDTEIQAIQAFINALPEGNLKTAMQKSTYGAFPTIAKWISGYKYTEGDYKLGEIFINRVMGKATTNFRDTPDTIVPIAWMYFSTLFGIPVAVNTDLDNIESGSLQQYLNGRPEHANDVSQEMVTRAKTLLDLLGHRTQTDPQWPPQDYGILPYVAPIPDPRIPGQLFNGQLPNGQQIQNGVPVSAATTGSDVRLPGSGGTAPVENNTGKVVLIIAALLGLWYLIENE